MRARLKLRTAFFFIMCFISHTIMAEINSQYIESFDLAMGHNHVCANTVAGVKCFGNADKVTTTAPLNLINPKMLSAANRFSCALVDEGIRCWGEIPNYKKSDMLISNKTFPAPKLLALGHDHACAVSIMDEIKCWGLNDFGEGNPPQDLKNITELSLGMSNSCAIAEGKVICWGLSVTGSLDVPANLVNPRNLTSGWWHHCVQTDEGIKCWGSPYKEFVAPKDPNITAFSSGGFFNCAVVSEGVKCWDEKGVANLVEGSAGAFKVSVGSTKACALTTEAGMICWKLSNRGVYKKMTSYVPAGGISQLQYFSAGPGSNCAYGDEGKLKCWGANFDNALDVPAQFEGPISQLSTGAHKTCVIKDAQLTCWGDLETDYNTPKDLGNVTMVSSGGFHVCAGDANSMKCWGDNIRGALDIPKELTNISQISAGLTHACAVANDQVTCWGGEGLIRNVNAKKITQPRAICAGGTFSCGISAIGKVECWGEKIPFEGDNAESNLTNVVLNVPHEITDAVEIACGGSHGCAIYNGKIKCWGSSDFLPQRLSPPTNIKNPRMLTAGWNHTCAMGDNGLVCWGSMIGMEMPNYSLEK